MTSTTRRLVGCGVALLVLGCLPATTTGAAVAGAAIAETCDGLAATDTWTRTGGVLRGTTGNDVFIGNTDLDIQALAGDDVVCRWSDFEAKSVATTDGGPGNDRLFADDGFDTLVGGAGTDYLYGGRDNDTFVGPGDDILDGSCYECGFESRYNDEARFLGVGRVVVDLAAGTARTAAGDDVILDIAAVTTGGGDDVLIGDASANVLDAGRGDDRLVGADGRDRLVGGPGRDRADGGVGRDRCRAETTRSC